MRMLRPASVGAVVLAMIVTPMGTAIAHDEDGECPPTVLPIGLTDPGGLVRPHELTKPITLTAAVPVAAAAISEAEVIEVPPAGVVISSTWLDGEASPESASAADDDVHLVGSWEASDPRLSGDVTYLGAWHYYPELDSELEAVHWTVVNDAGSWAGTGSGIYSPDAIYGDYVSAVLAGEGAYEGLTAYLMMDLAHDAGTIRGLVVADEPPPFPEPLTE